MCVCVFFFVGGGCCFDRETLNLEGAYDYGAWCSGDTILSNRVGISPHCNGIGDSEHVVVAVVSDFPGEI